MSRKYDVITDKVYNFPTSALIAGDRVTAPYSSIVLYVNKSHLKDYTVILQYGANMLFKFSNLEYITVKEGQLVDADLVIGSSSNKVKFEYLTAKKYDSRFPVRVNKVTYYKQDPRGVLDDTLLISDPGKLDITFGKYDPEHTVNWTDEMSKEFADGKGD